MKGPEKPKVNRSGIETVPFAPEGWKTRGELATNLDSTFHMVNNIVKKYRADHPEYFKNFKGVMGKVFEYYSPELITIITKEINEARDIPEGWKTRSMIFKDFGSNLDKITEIVNKYRSSNPEYFGQFSLMGKTGQSGEWFSPELVSIVLNELGKNDAPKVPVGWNTNNALSDKYGLGFRVMKQIADRYRETKPEFFKSFKNKRGVVCEYYSPELVDLIDEKIKQIKKAPEGWALIAPLADSLDISSSVIIKIANKYQEAHPEYFAEFRSDRGKFYEYYSPELVTLIKQEVIKLKTKNLEKSKDLSKVPEGWKTNNTFAHEVGVDSSTTKKFFNEYRKDHPEFFVMYKTEKNLPREHIAPQLLKIVSDRVKEFKETPFPPDNWENNLSLALKLDADRGTLKILAEKYRAHPEYFKHFKTKQGPIREYYSPELVELISKEIKDFDSITMAPEGWKTKGFLMEESGVDNRKIKNILGNYKEFHPEYFRNFKVKGGPIREHYSPEMVTIIRQKIEEYNKIPIAPDGWENNNRLAISIGAGNSSIEEIANNYRKVNKEYFKEYRPRGGGPLCEHYSPELVKIIKEEFARVEKAPEDWRTNKSLSSELGIGEKALSDMTQKYRTDHPEYFKELRPKRGQACEHYSPELVKIINEEVRHTPKAPDGWLTISSFSDSVGINRKKLEKLVSNYIISNPKYFKNYKTRKGTINEHYSPELIEIIRLNKAKEHENTPSASEGWKTKTNIGNQCKVGSAIVASIAEKYRKDHPGYFEQHGPYEYYSPELVKFIIEKITEAPYAPDGWQTYLPTAREFKTNARSIEKIIRKYHDSNPEYFRAFKDKSGYVTEHISPELIVIIREHFTSLKEAPEGWKILRMVSEDVGMGEGAVKYIVDKYRQTNPEYFKTFKVKSNKMVEHFSPELIILIKQEAERTPKAPLNWKSLVDIYQQYKVDRGTVQSMANQYRQNNPDYFAEYKNDRGMIAQYYSPELVSILGEKIEKFKLTPEAPDGWKTNFALATELKISRERIKNIAKNYREEDPQYFKEYRTKNGPLNEYYSPELVELIKQGLGDIRKIKELEEQENLLKNNFENLIQEIGNKETGDEEAKKIGEILRLLPGNAHDIILKYHPEYKGMKVGYVKKVIAEYLGDFMMVKKDWRGEDVERFKDVLDIKGVHDVILYNLKNACLTFVNQKRKINPNVDEYLLVNEYFQQPEMRKLETSRIEEIRKAVKELREYYDQIFALRRKKPTTIVESLKKGRVFPDVNQLLNIREMQEKKKMLIADEMGLGKSASAIMTKEYLGLKCALVVIPSNIEETWENYLSDRTDLDTGKQLGYFKPGMTPRVLMVNDAKDLKRLTTETFDYILISQEKMSYASYGDALEKVDFDMMIIDEVHKLKNIESGVRSQAVIKLAEKIQGENKYLTLLSGTPIPNKVQDIAISLKLLYPEKYKQFNNKDIVNRIIYGDLIDLRTEILMRTQMKELATSIEMPPLTEVDIPIDLSLVEREIYEILLEEDELTASDKIILFRQFLLNPELLSMEPGVIGAKIQKLEETLLEDLKTQDKIIVFVNDYVNRVIVGPKNIIEKMKLPDDVIIEQIYGAIDPVERVRIQKELKIPGKKTIVFVSGQTADVGVDFSGANGVIFYNEPWSKYTKKQEQARVYREGLQGALTSKTLITNNSIEEGIRRYINAKEKAVEKLLRGIQNTDAEKNLLRKDSKLATDNIETNAELSKEYLSDWEKLMVHFGEGFESGEKQFRQELPTKAVEYAQLYRKLGRLTYQGNNARVTATLIENMMMEQKQVLRDVKILDIASGPEMLKEAAQESLKDIIYSTDINAEHFMQSIKPKNTMASSYLNLPNLDKSIDYCNLSFAFHQTSPIKYYKKNYERLQVLAEMNRVLKPGGRAIISMLHNIKLGDGDKFERLVNQIGFKLVPEYSGDAAGGQNYRAGFFTLEKIEDTPKYISDAMKFDSADNAKYIRELGDSLGREFLEGLDMKKVSKGDSRLRDQRRMVETITLGGKNREVIFNEKDRELYEREVQSIADGEALRTKYGGIENIPLSEIKDIGFERKLETPGYFLLYKIIENGGAVIIRGDYKNKKKSNIT